MWQLTLTFSLLIAALPANVESASLFSMMQSAPNISTFVHLLNETGFGKGMSTGTCNDFRCYLVFAPTDAAFSAAYPSGVTKMTLADKKAILQNLYLDVFYPSNKKGLLSNWDSAGTPYGLDIGLGEAQILSPSGGTLFWLRKQNTTINLYHINNARLLLGASDKEADNGVYHVLNQVPLPIGGTSDFQGLLSSTNTALLSQLKITKSVQYFNQWIAGDPDKSPWYNALKQGTSSIKVRTVFLPSDLAWSALGDDGLNRLNSDLTARRELIAAHFALNYVLFTGWMAEIGSVDFFCGVNDLKNHSARMYVDSSQKSFVSVGGVVASFEAVVNYPLRNAVVHVINKPLGFLYRSLATLARDHAPSFFTACSSVSSCRAMMHSNTTNYTLFAPQSIDSLGGVTGEQLEQVLRLHFIPTHRVSRPEMTTGRILTSAGNAGQIQFRLQGNDTVMVEGRLAGRSFVRSRLIRWDEAAIYGIFHLIQNPLGQPDKNVVELISSLHDITNVSAYFGRSGFDPALNSPSQPVTVFAPSNAAMQKLRDHRNSNGQSTGQQVLANQALRDRVLRRMVVPNQKVQTSALSAGSYPYASGNTVEDERITLTLTGSAGASSRSATLTGAEVTANVNMSMGPYEATNGVVFVIDTVLFRDRDTVGYTRSGWQLRASKWFALLWLLPLLLLQH